MTWLFAFLVTVLFLPLLSNGSETAPETSHWQVRGILAALEDLNPGVKSMALDNVSLISSISRPPDIISRITTLLSDSDEHVRAAAAQALGNLGVATREQIIRLADRLQDSDGRVRAAAAQALGNLGAASWDQLPKLATLLDDLEENVCTTAAQVLATMGPAAKKYAPKLIAWLEDRRRRSAAIRALQTMAPIAEAHVHNLVALLSNPNDEVRIAALEVLTTMGPAARKHALILVELLGNRNKTIRSSAARVLGAMRQIAKEHATKIVELLRNPDWEIQSVAINTLVAMREEAKEQIPLILELLRVEDSEWFIRNAATRLLKAMGPIVAEYAPQIADLLEHPHPNVRIAAVEVLGAMGAAATEQIPKMVKLLQHPYGNVRVATVKALGAMGKVVEPWIPTIAAQLKDSDASVRGDTAAVLGTLGEPAKVWISDIAVLLRKDKEENEYVRSMALRALRTLGGMTQEHLPDTVELMKAKDKAARADAARALGAMGPAAEEHAGEIAELLDDQAGEVRAAAIEILSTLGPSTQTYIPKFLSFLKDPDPTVRRTIDQVLRMMPAAVKAYIPQIAELLKDPDDAVRSVAVGLLRDIAPSAQEHSPTIIPFLKDTNLQVRLNAVSILAAMGQVVPIATLLKDRNPRMRQATLQALATMEDVLKEYIPALVELLEDSDITIRINTARALGQMGPAVKEYAPKIASLLKYKDEDGDLQSAVTEALKAMAPLDWQSLPYIVSPIYDDLSRRAELRFLAHLLSGGDEEVELLLRWLGRPDRYPEDPLSHGFGVKTLEVFAKVWPAGTALPRWRDDLEKQIAIVASRVQWTPADLPLLRLHEKNLTAVKSTQAASVRNVIASLEWWQRTWQWIWQNLPWVPFLLAYIALLLSLSLLLLLLCPLWLYRVNEAIQPFTDLTLPPWLGGLKVPLRYLLLVGLFHYNRRVLDAWVAKYIAAARKEFQKKETVRDRHVHIPVPVVLDGQSITQLEPRYLQPVFSKKRGCLLIWGEGGAGKTSLACQVANWAMSDDPAIRLCDRHAMLPVLIEHELDMKITADKHLFTEAIRGELRAVINAEEPIPEALLLHLLKQRHILVIVDHFSEMSEATRKEIRPGHPDFPANALIITARINERLDGVPKTTLKPLRIQDNRLSSFMEAYLTQRGKRDLFDDPEYFDACRKLSMMVGTREITVLLAKLYAEQLITVKEGIEDVNLPENIPDLMLSYVNEVNRGIGGVGEPRPDDRTVHRVAKATAWECLKKTYRPTAARRDNILAALAAENNAETLLKYMEDRLRLIQTVGAGRDQIRFALDPLAEYLAGFYLVEHYDESEQDWRQFITQADTMPGAPETIKGFLLAVRDCCMTEGSNARVPEFVAVELARRVSPESQEQMSAR